MMDPQASAMEQLLSLQGGGGGLGLGGGTAAEQLALQQYRQQLLLSQSGLSPFMMGGAGLDPRLMALGQQVGATRNDFYYFNNLMRC